MIRMIPSIYEARKSTRSCRLGHRIQMPQVPCSVDSTKLPSVGIDPPKHGSHEQLDGRWSLWPVLPHAVLILHVEVGKNIDHDEVAQLSLF